MKYLLFLTFLFSSYYLFGQNTNLIKKQVADINQSKNLEVKIIPNDYFVDVKNEVTDNGQELKGFYRNSELKKMVHEVILSSQKMIFEYYFSKEKLIFVKMQKFQIIDENGFFAQPKLMFDGRYYFENEKLVRKVVKGNGNKENFNFVKLAKSLKKHLKIYKK